MHFWHIKINIFVSLSLNLKSENMNWYIVGKCRTVLNYIYLLSKVLFSLYESSQF